MKDAAFAPQMFRQLRMSYNNNLPDDDALIADFTNMGLHHNKINDAMRAYRGTIEFINEETKG